MWIVDNVDWGFPFLLSLSAWLAPPKHTGLSWANVLWSHPSPHASHSDGVARQPCLVTQQPCNPTEDADFTGSVMSECRYSTHAGRFKTLLQICMSNIKCISIKLYLLVQCRRHARVCVCVCFVYLHLSGWSSFCIAGRTMWMSINRSAVAVYLWLICIAAASSFKELQVFQMGIFSALRHSADTSVCDGADVLGQDVVWLSCKRWTWTFTDYYSETWSRAPLKPLAKP